MEYRIEYNWNQSDNDVSYSIFNEENEQVYTESVVGDFDSVADVEMTGLEIAKSREFWPASYNRAAQMGRIGGLATAKKGKKHFSEIGKKGAEKRWKKD